MRNPFRIQAAQHSVTDDEFVRLFAPGVLELLPEGELIWQRLLLIRSAPGGGKTTLLRLFTPGPLNVAHSYRSQDSYKEIFQYLTKFGALNDSGPDVLGVLLTFSQDYATLTELHKSQPLNDRAFSALLNSRLILSALRTVAERSGLSYPDQLDQLLITHKPEVGSTIPSSANGREIFAWASAIEEAVFEALDSLDSTEPVHTPGHESLFALHWFADASFTKSGQPISGKRLVMLDDVQALGTAQRQWLLEKLTNFRRPLGLWVAERFEALRADELLASGSRNDRDFITVVELETQWRESHPNRFQKFTATIADIRARQATGFEGGSFGPHLASTLDGTEWERKVSNAMPDLEERVRMLAGNNERYKEWIIERSSVDIPPHQRAISWRSLEILIERDKRKSQAVFEFDVLSADELHDRERSKELAAAELLLSRELGLPYFFGLDRLVLLASSNVEQFLELSGDLFEEIASAAIMKRRPLVMDPERQDEILRRSASARWKAIPQGTLHGVQAQHLLEAIGTFCLAETTRPNAPYAPGVTGIGILMTDRQQLIDADKVNPKSKRGQLAATIASCIAQNLLEARPDYPNKDDKWLVLYLNRMFCAKFGIPLGYGGWRPKKIDELVQWMDRGSGAVEKARLL